MHARSLPRHPEWLVLRTCDRRIVALGECMQACTIVKIDDKELALRKPPCGSYWSVARSGLTKAQGGGA